MAETREFRTELKELMHIIVHSLYSHKEVFLRELVSNACDAIDRRRFASLTQPELAPGDTAWAIRVVPDAEAGTITVSDNGIGMSRDAIAEDLGTIAKSGSRQFLSALEQADAEDRLDLIGQFGVGFYAAFMVAERVAVISRPAGGDAAVRWESTGEGSFTLDRAERAGAGTDVVLYLKEDEREFLEPWRLRQIVHRFSDFIEHPVVLVTEEKKEESEETETKEETLNSQKAPWLRPRSELGAEEAHEFYKHLTRDHEDPAKVIHYAAEGTLEFRALLFFPAHRPFDLLWSEQKPKLHLYVKRVFITDDCEQLLPPYLRFVKGVVDSSDLPLNVSREMLQHNPTLARIRKSLVNKVLSALEEMRGKDYDKYVDLFRNFGAMLKEGVAQDPAQRETVGGLLLYPSTRTDEATEFVSLDQYVEAMDKEQEAIYFLAGDDMNLLRASPHLEAYRAGGKEVLLLPDPVDEFVMQHLGEYKGRKLQPVDRIPAPAPEAEASAEEKEEREKAFGDVVALFTKTLGDAVKEARLSDRLRESAACLVLEAGAMGAQMERLMRQMTDGGAAPSGGRILEINPTHPVIEALRARLEANPGDPRLADTVHLVHDEAVLAEGSRVPDAAAFAKRLNDLLAKHLAE